MNPIKAPSSPSQGQRRPASPAARPGSPGVLSALAGDKSRPGSSSGRKCKAPLAVGDETNSEIMLYGDMVAAFNLLQKEMGHVKADLLRNFKNDVGCEIVNMLLMGPRMTHMYLCIGGKWYTVPSEKSIAGYCALTGETLNIPDVHADNRFNIDADCATGFVTKTMLCKPILSRRDKSVIGVIELINKMKRTEGHSFIKGSDSFNREDEIACDLFVQKLSKEIDDNFCSLYVNDILMDAFVKPISDVSSKSDEPQYLKTTTATEMSHAFHQVTNPHLSPEERDFYAEHQSTRLRLGTSDARMSAQEGRDRELGEYLRGRRKKSKSPTDRRPSSRGLLSFCYIVV